MDLIVAKEKCKKDCREVLNSLIDNYKFNNFLNFPSLETLESLCSVFKNWQKCNSSLDPDCRGESFNSTYLFIFHSCTFHYSDIKNNMNCLRNQCSDNSLFAGCQVMLELKGVSCQAMNELLTCEDKLIRTACGSRVATFRLSISIEARLRLPSNHLNPPDTSPPSFPPPANSPFLSSPSSLEGCLYQAQESLNDENFEYSINCSPNFPVTIATCYDQFSKVRISFHPFLRSVVRSSHQLITAWCLALHEYDQCISRVQETCPEGVDHLYKTSFLLKKTFDTAVYVCDRSEGEYFNHLPCYKKLASKPTLCSRLYQRSPPEEIMYKVKCHPHHSNSTVEAFSKVEGKIRCFGDIVQRECGEDARKTIYPLLRIHYSFDFLPLCSKFKPRTTLYPRTTRKFFFTPVHKPITDQESKFKLTSNPFQQFFQPPTQTCICPTLPPLPPFPSSPKFSHSSFCSTDLHLIFSFVIFVVYFEN